MINLVHSQDIRFLSSGSLYTPFSRFIIYVSLLNLIGLPRLVGFFSKDLVLESSNFTNFGLFLYLIFLINLVFTFYYTFQLFYYSYSFNKTCSYLSFNSPPLLHSILLLFLGLFSLLFGYFFLSFISMFTFFVPVPLFLKLFPNLILLFFLGYVLISLSMYTSNSQIINSYFSTIMFLYPFITKVITSFYYTFSFHFVKTFELGSLNSFLNFKSPSFFYSIRYSFLQSSSFPSFYFVSFCAIFLLPLLIF
jgi:NADH:ubiquinone oxidoreductase subunit 5 (subunit L)/multisubunit Na+/H+ antiporter MnhA subunit